MADRLDPTSPSLVAAGTAMNFEKIHYSDGMAAPPEKFPDTDDEVAPELPRFPSSPSWQ